MPEGLRIFLCVYLGLNALGTIMFAVAYITGVCIGELKGPAKTCFLLPVGMHAWSKMNWFGCILTSIAALAIGPGCWMIQFVYYIFHIGRKV